MECAFGLPELVSRNPVLRDLDETGYLIDFVGGYLVIYGLPYLDAQGGLQHGDWVSPLDLDGALIGPPSNHQAWWRGTRPHDQQGRVLRLGGGLDAITVVPDLITTSSFSYKLMDQQGILRAYASFEEKVQTYLEKITTPAIDAYPKATPFRAIAVKAAVQGSPLRLPDTMSARYNLNDLSALLRGKKVAIVGLGGTGASSSTV